jgi:hypothetical protein
LRRDDPELVRRFSECIVVADEGAAPPLVAGAITV